MVIRQLFYVLLPLCLINFTRTANADQSFEIELIRHSQTYCQAIAINRDRAVIGIREITEKDITSQSPFFSSPGKPPLTIPKLTGFTNIELEALSDTGLVVGYASRAIGHPDGSLTAFVWDSQSDSIKNLGRLPNDSGSHAQDISADGTRITGYSTGSNPAKIRPCLWTFDASTGDWRVEALPTLEDYNPFLQSSRVIISPNGKWIAACVTVKQISPTALDSSLMMWQEKEGMWQRRVVSVEQPKLKDVNDHGTMVGSTLVNNQVRACLVTSDGKMETIDLLPGDLTNIATGINNAGNVIGYSDDPPGTDGGSTAFIYQQGKVTQLSLPEDTVDSAALGINEEGAITGYLLENSGEDSTVVGFVRISKS